MICKFGSHAYWLYLPVGRLAADDDVYAHICLMPILMGQAEDGTSVKYIPSVPRTATDDGTPL